MDLSKLDLGPYQTADDARTMLRLGVLDSALAGDEAHLRLRGAVVIDLALSHSGVDLTDFEASARDEIARTVADPALAQVVAGWIRRAWQAGHLAAIADSGPIEH